MQHGCFGSEVLLPVEKVSVADEVLRGSQGPMYRLWQTMLHSQLYLITYCVRVRISLIHDWSHIFQAVWLLPDLEDVWIAGKVHVNSRKSSVLKQCIVINSNTTAVSSSVAKFTVCKHLVHYVYQPIMMWPAQCSKRTLSSQTRLLKKQDAKDTGKMGSPRHPLWLTKVKKSVVSTGSTVTLFLDSNCSVRKNQKRQSIVLGKITAEVPFFWENMDTLLTQTIPSGV